MGRRGPIHAARRSSRRPPRDRWSRAGFGEPADRRSSPSTATSPSASRPKKRCVESEKRLRFALEGANEGLWDWSIDTGDVYFSPAAELMLGYEPGEMERRAGGTWDQSLHPDDMPAVQRAIDEHVAGHTAGVRSRVPLSHQAGRLEVDSRARQSRRATPRTARRVG